MAAETLSCDCWDAAPCDVILVVCQVIVCHLFSDGDFEWWVIVKKQPPALTGPCEEMRNFTWWKKRESGKHKNMGETHFNSHNLN